MKRLPSVDMPDMRLSKQLEQKSSHAFCAFGWIRNTIEIELF